MDTQRLILFIVFSFSLLLLWQAWQDYNGAKVGVAPAPRQGSTDAVPQPSQALGTAVSTLQPLATQAATLPKGQRIRVRTDVIDAELDTIGGDLRKVVLLRHGATEDRRKPMVLLADDPPHWYVAQSGLLGKGLPTHKEVFRADRSAYTLTPEAQTVDVRLTWEAPGGLRVDKVYTFRRGSYLIGLRYEIHNTGTAPLAADAYFQFLRDDTPPAGESSLMPTYTGPAVYTEADKFHKIPFSDIAKGKPSVKARDGWVAMLQHYFLAAYLPPAGPEREYYTRKLADHLYAVGVILPVGQIAPGATAVLNTGLYVGPQDQETLKTLAPGLDLAVDYGMLTIIAKPLFWLLKTLHGLFGNWGWAIIALTVLIKLVFYPLSAASYRSMAKMKAVAPRLQQIKERYGDDRQKLHQAMMELYKSERINPMGGCLPVLIQIPVFIALYWVLLYSVEMRHAPFALWIQDLTAPDPYYVLPVLMGLSMIVQTKLNPTPPDPIQAKVMMIMPIVFSVMFFFFPAGLVLYWLVNNLLSILQQWRINSLLGGETKGGTK
ncbi:membrane protein insertase YidC [Thiobacter aerophilum]|uniref:Membrane protein insertase YidC n=1 Tax=Thiobacter aerophilum TaxID=3121275 RepID=A0ABV0ED12_9BURK